MKNLSSDERNIISRGLGIHRKKKLPGYAVLFRRLVELDNWTDDSEKIIRGRELTRFDVFSRTREDLLNRIITLLIQKEGTFKSEEYIAKAVGFTAIERAKKSLATSIEHYLEKEDFFRVRSFIQLALRIGEIYRVGLLSEDHQKQIPEVIQACVIDGQIQLIQHDL